MFGSSYNSIFADNCQKRDGENRHIYGLSWFWLVFVGSKGWNMFCCLVTHTLSSQRHWFGFWLEREWSSNGWTWFPKTIPGLFNKLGSNTECIYTELPWSYSIRINSWNPTVLHRTIRRRLSVEIISKRYFRIELFDGWVMNTERHLTVK